ncbi:diacylglycerol/lipid kinase family protein [Sporosalibacterium faouarense]|uniref:diacylglycerol/lipid kinase family protein n=1 Tax=Sporosalibacterium faouarense TaxID=516123 RepID=UPI00192CDE5B|nr:diacylglycerol kinase family protein [Sporosalibacterium faouarense]
MKILFIINPIAGRNKSTDIAKLIKAKMSDSNKEYKIEYTRAPRHAIALTKKGLKENYGTIVAVGGDGTINEVAEGILNIGYGNLGLLPMGTGNDLAKSLGLVMDPAKALDVIIKGELHTIDAGKVDGRIFLNVGSIGFDAEIAKNTENIKTLFKGKIAYILGLLVTLFKYRNKKVCIELDGEILEEEILLVAIGNGKYYGGGMKICPSAELNDGYFDVCIIDKISKLKLLFIFPSVFKGNHLKHTKYVKNYKANEVKIKSKDRMYINIDGEVFHFNEKDIFSMHDNKIDVICG